MILHFCSSGCFISKSWRTTFTALTNWINNLSFFHDWITKLTLKDNKVSYCLTLFARGRPCHLSSFKQCSGTLFFLWEQLVCSLMEICLYYYMKRPRHTTSAVGHRQGSQWVQCVPRRCRQLSLWNRQQLIDERSHSDWLFRWADQCRGDTFFHLTQFLLIFLFTDFLTHNSSRAVTEYAA